MIASIQPGTDVASCDREPIHIPGAIQPHGLLLVADAASLIVSAGAGDIEGQLSRDLLREVDVRDWGFGFRGLGVGSRCAGARRGGRRGGKLSYSSLLNGRSGELIQDIYWTYTYKSKGREGMQGKKGVSCAFFQASMKEN